MKTHRTTVTRSERSATAQAVQQAAQEALQQALDRRDNGGETGH